MIEKCFVKIVGNKVVCDSNVETKKIEKERNDENVKNKKKFSHLIGIGMDLDKYHPTIIRTMVDGGRNFKIPENLKQQLILFANEAHQKGFNPSLFGYNTTLHKFIKTVHSIPKRKYNIKGKGVEVVAPIPVKEIAKKKVEIKDESESETDLDDILSSVESDIEGGRIKAVKLKMKKYKHRIPVNYYNKIMENI
jgi:hypothetical protein